MTGTVIEDLIIYQKDDGYVVSGNITRETIKIFPEASEAIQFSINRLADAGGSITLSRGKYQLNETVYLKNNIEITGSGRGTELIVNGETDNDAGLICQGNNQININNIFITTKNKQIDTGIIMDDCGDCKISNVHVVGFAGYGIWLRNSSFFCEIRSCRLADNDQANIYLDHLWQGRGGDWVPNLISNCIIYGGGKGIELHRSIVINIVGCQLYQTKDVGYHIHSHSNSVLISGCRSYQLEKDAVVVDTSHEINISSNIFCWHRGDGIVLRDVKWGSINGNNVIDTGVRDKMRRIGIILSEETKGVQVVGNAIFNWGDQLPMKIGIKEDEECVNNIISNNNINYCTDKDVLAKGSGTVVKDNVSDIDNAYIGMDREKKYPDFTRERLNAFIGEIKDS